MKKVLIVLTNVSKYTNHDIPTGLWLGELVHFYDEIQKHGIEADFVSPKGGYVPLAPYSMKFMDDVDYKWYQDKGFVTKALAQTKSPDEINPSDYVAIYYTGVMGWYLIFLTISHCKRLLWLFIRLAAISLLFVMG